MGELLESGTEKSVDIGAMLGETRWYRMIGVPAIDTLTGFGVIRVVSLDEIPEVNIISEVAGNRFVQLPDRVANLVDNGAGVKELGTDALNITSFARAFLAVTTDKVSDNGKLVFIVHEISTLYEVIVSERPLMIEMFAEIFALPEWAVRAIEAGRLIIELDDK